MVLSVLIARANKKFLPSTKKGYAQVFGVFACIAFFCVIFYLQRYYPDPPYFYEFAGVGEGEGVEQAAAYEGQGIHPIIMSNLPNMESFLDTGYLPREWWPTNVTEVQLVVLVGDREGVIEVCEYLTGPDIRRIQNFLDVELREAKTGRLIASTTLCGSVPRECRQWAPLGKTRIVGSSVSTNELIEWLETYVVTERAHPAPAKPIHHIDNFLLLEKNSSLQAQFVLKSEDLDFISTDGTVQLAIFDQTTNRTLYETEFTIKKGDFKHYETIIGTEVLGYQWSIPLSGVEKCIFYGTAKITFTATDGNSCSDTEGYLTLPKYTEDEIIQMYEDMFLQSAITVQQTITKGDFSITLEKVGHFTHLEWGTSGDEVTEFRVDLKVTNIAGEPKYIFESNIVILDNIGNQYNYEHAGTLDLGKIYLGITKEGYVLFPALNENATIITVIVTYTEFPEDIVYEFTVNL